MGSNVHHLFAEFIQDRLRILKGRKLGKNAPPYPPLRSIKPFLTPDSVQRTLQDKYTYIHPPQKHLG